RALGLGQPGGPAIEAAARAGDPAAVVLPRPLLDRPGCDMSFSGLKTAVLRARDGLIAATGGLSTQDQADLSAGFQAAICDVLAEKSRRAMAEFRARHASGGAFAVAGGVAANMQVRAALETVSTENALPYTAPPLALCTDNAAMIAYAGLERLALGDTNDMTLAARPRWPLDTAQAPMLGFGKKGAKA
ncbi:MAG: tRNA (adenosine(37)-N6)-threonylcarbamoyltransferase complex transferase subunit TsaD, partial [Pseudomonadota bacterium]